MNHRPFALLLLTAAVSACMSDRAARREVVDLRRQVDAMRQKAVRDQRTIRELENRLFVLEDRLETAQVQGARIDRAPRLPAPAPAPAAPPPVAPPLQDESQVEIVYEGEALGTSGPRPSIAVNESGRKDDWVRVDEPRPKRTRPVAGPESGYPDPAAVTDRINVMPLGPNPVAVYKEAYAALQRHDHAAAIAAFQKLLEKWPEHDYADNAQYWLGEAHYDKRDYKTALLEFRKVVQRYPTGNKAPDALLKVGYCYANLGDAGSARDVLSQVVDIYPKTDAAKLAAKRLEEFKQP